MEDEFLKRNTDCIYFLASPLTCKKGSQCEYRHSEGARLNPRDCWFWLEANCLNPHCAFRHPPLDAWTGPSSDFLPAPQLPSLSKPKSSVPCHYYSSGYCIKGDQCPFLHSPNGVQPFKLSKNAEGSTAGHQLENETPTEASTRPVSSNPPYTLKSPPRVPDAPFLQNSHGHDDGVSETEHCPSPQACAPEADDSKSSKSPLHEEDAFFTSQPVLLEGQSPEDYADGAECNEWWESSPGLDVLVDDESECLGCEEDAEYMLLHNRGNDQIHSLLVQRDYEDTGGFGHYSDFGLPQRHVTFDAYEPLESSYYVSGSNRRTPRRCRVQMPEQLLSSSRRRARSDEIEGGYQSCVNLRHHLKRRRINCRTLGGYPRDHQRSLHMNDAKREWRGRRILEQNRGRMLSEIVKNRIVQYGESDSRLRDNNRGGGTVHMKSRYARRRDRERPRRQTKNKVYSEVSRGQGRHDHMDVQETGGFAGRKTLSQIKEEKKRTREGEDGLKSIEHNDRLRGSRDGSKHFQGPKPLSELLKDKIRPGSLGKKASRLTSILARDPASCHEDSVHRDGREHENGYTNDEYSRGKGETNGVSDKMIAKRNECLDADDDDDFEQKLENMYS